MSKNYKSGTIQALSQIEPSLKTNTVVAMARTIQERDTHGEIARLSSIFLESLPQDMATKELRSLARDFDRANALTWISYSLFDKIIDEPEAIALSHTSTTLSSSVALKDAAIALYLSHKSAANVTLRLFEQTNLAIHHELTLCRATITPEGIIIPHLQDKHTLEKILTEKSIAHITGPAILSLITTPEKHVEIINELRIYCGARQQLDDLHDWENDLRSGNITLVVATLLKKYGATEESIHHLDSLIPELRRVFWESVAEETCQALRKTAEQSVESLGQLLGISADSTFITATLHPIIRSASLTIETIGSQKRLLRSMRRRNTAP